MTIQQLRCFVCTAKYQSFHRAAEHLFISQPAVSHQIGLLEKELGTALFDRSQRKSALTAAGKIFYEDAMDILDRVDFAVQHVHSTESGGQIKILCESRVQVPQLSEILIRYRAMIPYVTVNFTTERREESRSLIQKRLVDIAIMPEVGAQNLEGLSSMIVDEGELYCLLPKNHRLANAEQLDIPDLQGETMIFPDNANCPPEIKKLQYRFREQCNYTAFCYAGRIEQVYTMIGAGFGVAVMPSYVLLPSGSLRAVPFGNGKKIPLAAVWNAVSERPEVRAFVQVMKEVLARD